MSRPLRLEFPGAFYHVTARGNRRESIYQDDDDRQIFLSILGQTCRHCNWHIHAYCLMSNHYHLVIETPEANLSAGMRQLNGVYTQRYNRRHGCVGHVLQGRYKAILVDKEPHLLGLTRYVVLNPVRANMVGTAGQWPWSSYCAMIGKTSVPGWLETDWLLAQFDVQRDKARQQYIRFVAAGSEEPSIWRHLKQHIYLGDEHFVENMQTFLTEGDDLSEIPRAQCRPAPRTLGHYARAAATRHEALAAAYETGQYSLKEIAAYFGVHYSTVSRAVAQHKLK